MMMSFLSWGLASPHLISKIYRYAHHKTTPKEDLMTCFLSTLRGEPEGIVSKGGTKNEGRQWKVVSKRSPGWNAKVRP